jgi:hypothetical protein
MSGFLKTPLENIKTRMQTYVTSFRKFTTIRGLAELTLTDTTFKMSSNVFATFGVPRDPEATLLVG